MLGKLAGRVSGLALGTAAGHGLVLLATPFLARQYAPADFGLLALLMTVANVSTSAACLRYDLALPSAQPREVRGLLISALGCSAALGVAIVVAVVIAGGDWAQPAADLFEHPWMIGCCVMLVGGFQATTAWLLHEGAYSSVAWLRFSQGAIFMGVAFVPMIGLGWAQALSFAGGLLALSRVRRAPRRDEATWRECARTHRQFPLVSLPGALLDVCGYSLCIWIIDLSYGHDAAGNYSQVQRLIGAPLMLLSISLGQVLLKHTAELADNLPALRQAFRRLFGLMGAVALAGLLGVALFGEPVLRALLGTQWNVNREFAVLVAVAVFVRACVSPLSTVLITLRRLRLGASWQAAYFCSAAILMPLVASRFGFADFLRFYALHEAIFYGIYLWLIFGALNKAKGPPDKRACSRPA
jgi:O-antigen/teichoic acid export membrane protein